LASRSYKIPAITTQNIFKKHKSMGVYIQNNNYNNKHCLYTGVTEYETNQLHLMTDLCNSSRKVVSSQFVRSRLTNFMGQSPSEKLTGHQPVQKYPAFYETQRFITAFTTAHHSSLF